MIRLVASDDGGRTWSWRREPRGILYRPKKPGFMAVSPQMIRLSDGRLVCVFATDEERNEPDRPGSPPSKFNMDVKCVVSRDDGKTWSDSLSFDESSHRAYMPGIVQLTAGGDAQSVLWVWLDMANGYRGRLGGLPFE